jgi:hypothetical protein
MKLMFFLIKKKTESGAHLTQNEKALFIFLLLLLLVKSKFNLTIHFYACIAL